MNVEKSKNDGAGLDNEVVAAQLRVCAAGGACEHSHAAARISQAERWAEP
jgi:hypothetical protein